MFFMLDNYDSFVYNLAAYFCELNQEIIVRKPEQTSLKEIEQCLCQGIIISPGPGRPSEAAFALKIIDKFKGRIPIFGVCLGHQVIGHYFGSAVNKGIRPMHGKVTQLTHNGKALFQGLPDKYMVTRYHSLVIDPQINSSQLHIDAITETGEIMAVSHKLYPIHGVQFHPEAVLTEHGHELIGNFIRICSEWRAGG